MKLSFAVTFYGHASTLGSRSICISKIQKALKFNFFPQAYGEICWIFKTICSRNIRTLMVFTFLQCKYVCVL